MVSRNILVIIDFLLTIYILIVNLVFILTRWLICLLMVVFSLIVAVDYLRNTNSIVVLFFLQLLLSELLSNCCLFSGLRHTSAISDTEVSDTEVLMLVASHQICNTI